MIYFDNAATGGKKPLAVQNAVIAALRASANPGRSGHRLSVACAEEVYRCRCALSDYFHGYGPDRVVFTKNCTEALNIAIFSAARNCHVVTTELEHNSVLRPLAYLKNHTVCPLNEGRLDPERIKSLLTPETKAVIVTLASNVTGYAPDIAAIKSLLPEDVLLLCDGAQACGHVDVDMQALGIDALAVAGHKGMCGIQGTGVLLFSERFQPSPILYGGTGTESFSTAMPDYYPERLEAGTLNFPAIAALHEGISYLKTHAAAARKSVFALTRQLCAGLEKSVILYSRPNPYGIVAFASEKKSSEQIAFELSEYYDIAVRGGLHCAPLVHRAVDRTEGGSVRVSVSEWNTPREVDRLLYALNVLL